MFGVIRSIIMLVAAGYAGLGLLAVVLLVRQERKRSISGGPPISRFCQKCGTEMNIWALACPSCGLSIGASRGPENQDSVDPNPNT
ncbi:MAG: hypothetical protein AUF79_19030 [Crenarchaeota archaeon 13_1_20CM_2_51_8]|nr:MAG: hypothetical protein AUF79_19030 [Crenarchaeota archaeon 13_1_20CM_2_51_8]